MLNNEQGKGIAERVLYGLAIYVTAWGVRKGWYDADYAAYLASGLVTLLGGAWAWWINRPKALSQAVVSASPKAIVITTPEIAKATPEQPNIVSSVAEAAEVKKAA